MKIDDICAIVLKYEEPGWTEQTIACCEAAGITKIVIADRDGVGNMSKAFNRAVKSAGVFDSKYIWFLTNVTFTPDVPLALMAAFDPFTACVHPCHDSDHAHLKVCGHTPQEVPFVEFTAPMFRALHLWLLGDADETMPYWGMDLDWSYRAKQAGYNLKVSLARVQHVYLRHQKSKHPISTFREQLRAYHHSHTEAALVQKYGPKWEQILWPR
jgi:hypothetical protein